MDLSPEQQAAARERINLLHTYLNITNPMQETIATVNGERVIPLRSWRAAHPRQLRDEAVAAHEAHRAAGLGEVCDGNAFPWWVSRYRIGERVFHAAAPYDCATVSLLDVVACSSDYAAILDVDSLAVYGWLLTGYVIPSE